MIQEVDITKKNYSRQEYNSIMDLFNCWKELYKDPENSSEERDHLINKIHETYLQNEDILHHFDFNPEKYNMEDNSEFESSSDS